MYLDNSSTTKPYSEVIEYVTELLHTTYANPNSVNYELGLESKRIIENARNKVAEFVNAKPEEIYFLPSASAANNLAIVGFMNKNLEYHNWVTTNIEHSSILDINLIRSKTNKNIVKCNNGFVFPEQFKKYRNCLISVMGANNEIGSVQPIKEIGKIVHKNNCIFHSDLTQFIPYFKVNVKDLNLDMATFSMHKLRGLKGCGILYVKKGIELAPLVAGSQQNGLFGGTEDIYTIAAAGKAIELYTYNNIKDLQKKRDYLLINLLELNGVFLNGKIENRLPCNLNIIIKSIELDNIQLSSILDLYGYQVATGSSCHSGDKSPSHVLLACGMNINDINHSIRITINNDITYEQIDKFCSDLNNIIEQFKR